jgi:uncharacterized protein YqjF (DUF2071 family)
MFQTWHDLLFAHWPVAPGKLRPLVPTELPLDIRDGQCWVAVTPFHMSGVRPRGFPALPGLSRFPELNVRTYVTLEDKPGVYFFSLDAANLAAVWAARTFYHLPYFYARMKAEVIENEVSYFSRRNYGEAELHARYRPVGAVQLRLKGSLENWLTERYCLYTVVRRRVYRAEIHHLPWPLQDANAEIEQNSMAATAGIALPNLTPLLHFAKRLDVLIWPVKRLC